MKTELKPQIPGPAEVAEQATALAASVTDSMRSLSGLRLPPRSLLKLQSDYLAESTALWNQMLSSARPVTASMPTRPATKSGRTMPDARRAP